MTKLSFNEVQSKTVQFCKNLLDNNIYTIENYNKCIDSFSKDKGAIIPDEMEIPRTGVDINYGLYNRDKKYLEKIELTTLGQKMMITSNDGRYLGCNNQGKLYHKSDYNKVDINQEEIEWSFISHGNNKFSIMSVAHHKYLSSDSNNVVSANAEDMNISTIWKFRKVENQTMMESIILPNYFIHYDKRGDYCMKISEGINEEKMWNFYPVNDNTKTVDEFDETSYKNNKTIIFDNYVKYKKMGRIIKTEILILQEVLNLVRNIFENLSVSLNNIYIESRNEISKKTGQYLRELGEIDQFRMKLGNTGISSSLFDSYSDQIKDLENKIGMKGKTYLTLTHKKKMDRELEKLKNQYIAMIMMEIKKRNNLYIQNENLSNSETKVDEFILEIKGEVNKVDEEIDNNNKIMKKQMNQIEEIKSNNYFKKSNKLKLKEKSKIINFNTNVTKERYNTLKKKRIYLIITLTILLISIIGLIYYNYITIKDIYY